MTGSGPLILRTVRDLAASCEAARRKGQGVALVPTMGALHAGHLALVREARRRADFVVVSIFVNPTQFAPGDDFDRYPRNLDEDIRQLAPLEVAAVFAPLASEMYPTGEETRVRVPALAEPLCGRFRPGHFEGVATIVAKLFIVVGACDAIFGRKDYQQLLVIRRMARDLLMPVMVIEHPIVREPDGLAMSSRNAYLSPSERVRALALVRGLDAAASAFAHGERRPEELERLARISIEPSANSIDYVTVCDAETLLPFAAEVRAPALLAVACRIGGTRLIDNVVLGGAEGARGGIPSEAPPPS